MVAGLGFSRCSTKNNGESFSIASPQLFDLSLLVPSGDKGGFALCKYGAWD